jgi:hypothetical protein
MGNGTQVVGMLDKMTYNKVAKTWSIIATLTTQSAQVKFRANNNGILTLEILVLMVL